MTTVSTTAVTFLGKTPAEWGDIFILLAILIAIGAVLFFGGKWLLDKTKSDAEDEDGEDEEDGDEDGDHNTYSVGKFKVVKVKDGDKEIEEVSLKGKLIGVHFLEEKLLKKPSSRYSLEEVKEINTPDGCVYLNPEGELMIDVNRRKLS